MRWFQRGMALILALSSAVVAGGCATAPRGSGDLAVIIERASGSVVIAETSHNTKLARISGLGDLSHASIVFSRDERYAYVFGRDGGLTKVDVLQQRIARRIMQSGNSIGGAISQDGTLIAVANYEPGGVKIFDADSLNLIADIPATGNDGKSSKVVGLEDAPGNVFMFSLYDAGEIWLADMSEPQTPKISKYTGIGRQPYDALVSLDGRYYIAGLFGEDGLALFDLWQPGKGVRRILNHYGKGEQPLPVYKMPHLEGWALTEEYAYLPAIGRHEVLVVDRRTWQEVGRIQVHGQPVFAMVRPDGRQLWVNFALPHNDTVQVIDTTSNKIIKTLQPGKGVLHMEFTPRGERVWLSVRDDDRIDVYDTGTLKLLTSFSADKPSGIFFTARAHKTGL